MLENTFLHIPKIGPVSEKSLWEKGIRTWDDLLDDRAGRLIASKRYETMVDHVLASKQSIADGNPSFFASGMSHQHIWRIFPHFRNRTAYLDIETTGFINEYGTYITTIVLLDKNGIRWYVHGDNLAEFKDDIFDYDVLVTYNGKTFDVPFIERQFGIRLPHVQIDLRYLLKNLGYSGGLKACERQLGISRGKLDGLDGYMAVLLWRDFKKNGNREALETLLAYNIEDVVNLEKLAVIVYNQNVKETPFTHLKIDETDSDLSAPFQPDMKTIERIKGKAL
jgi:uncharacterized protein YprB with RNaseH-like and TPR domain